MTLHPLAVINIVGLSDDLLSHTPRIRQAMQTQVKLETAFPAVTCPVQATFMTGKLPKEHGIVANGWYFRDLAQVWLWRQSNYLIEAPKFWDSLHQKYADFKVAKLFWWFNMYSSADISVTPRPSYLADGSKIPDIYTIPRHLREELQSKLGQFPLFRFWGPLADITSSAWIAKCAKEVFLQYRPHLSLVYLPHLDYNLQRLGPNDPKVQQDLAEIDQVAGELIEFFLEEEVTVVVLSEYAILPVTGAVHINRILRQEGLLEVHTNYVGELLDPGACRAFAVADHQVAHLYIRHREDVPVVRRLLEGVDGIAKIWERDELKTVGLDHPRSGELVLLAEKNRWFSYYYWLDDARAPDFARTVDIHQKPGYDPVELFFSPKVSKFSLAIKLARKKLGFRTVMDVIPLDTSLVRGSHGWVTKAPDPMPVFLCSHPMSLSDPLSATEVPTTLLQLLERDS